MNVLHGGENVTEPIKSTNDVPLEASIPDGAVPLESILCTEELHRRPWRPPDYGKENRALVALAIALADSPHTILQTLAEKVLEVLQADSAGLSLLTNDEQRFYWAAIAGAWQPHIGGGTPRDFGPCGDVLDRNVPMLFTHWERRYPYLRPATPLAEEGLLVPFYVRGKAVGTIWAIAHNDRRKFDAEDLRLLESLGRFASAAYQVLASIDDLTVQIAAREKAEAALRELAHGLEAKLRRLVDANIIGICIWNFEGRILEANDAFLRIVGYGREDLVSGRVSWREVTPDEWRAADEQALAEIVAGGICAPFEKEYLRKDGSRVPVLVGAASLEARSNEGVAFVLDLTERKRAEQRLMLQHTVTQMLAEAVSLEEVAPKILETVCEFLLWEVGALWSVDAEAGVLHCIEVWHRESVKVPQFEAVCRQSTFMPGIGLPGRIWSSHEPAYIPDVVDDANFPRASIARGEGLHAAFGFPIMLGGDVVGVMEFFVREIRQSEQELLSMVAILGSQIGQFIEGKRAEEKLHKAQAELAHVTRVTTMGELTASIAHEVNQPLTAVLTNANASLRWLVGDPPDLEEARACLRRILRDGHRAGEVLTRIRSLVKKSAPAQARLDLNDTVQEVLLITDAEARRHRVFARTDLAAALPPVWGDRVQLQQVLLNLVMNGIEAMREVTDRPRELLIRSRPEESSHVLVAVQDRGTGLDEPRLKRVFEAFYTTKPEGMGMGLPISRSIIEAHGGRLWAARNAGPGVTFQFTLPLPGAPQA
jgi:PAS domain S-box-containing protein